MKTIEEIETIKDESTRIKEASGYINAVGLTRIELQILERLLTAVSSTLNTSQTRQIILEKLDLELQRRSRLQSGDFNLKSIEMNEAMLKLGQRTFVAAMIAILVGVLGLVLTAISIWISSRSSK
jgi:hypothetical protein